MAVRTSRTRYASGDPHCEILFSRARNSHVQAVRAFKLFYANWQDLPNDRIQKQPVDQLRVSGVFSFFEDTTERDGFL